MRTCSAAAVASATAGELHNASRIASNDTAAAAA
jgi:hypothetical protein